MRQGIAVGEIRPGDLCIHHEVFVGAQRAGAARGGQRQVTVVPGLVGDGTSVQRQRAGPGVVQVAGVFPVGHGIAEPQRVRTRATDVVHHGIRSPRFQGELRRASAHRGRFVEYHDDGQALPLLVGPVGGRGRYGQDHRRLRVHNQVLVGAQGARRPRAWQGQNGGVPRRVLDGRAVQGDGGIRIGQVAAGVTRLHGIGEGERVRPRAARQAHLRIGDPRLQDHPGRAPRNGHRLAEDHHDGNIFPRHVRVVRRARGHLQHHRVHRIDDQLLGPAERSRAGKRRQGQVRGVAGGVGNGPAAQCQCTHRCDFQVRRVVPRQDRIVELESITGRPTDVSHRKSGPQVEVERGCAATQINNHDFGEGHDQVEGITSLIDAVRLIGGHQGHRRYDAIHL